MCLDQSWISFFSSMTRSINLSLLFLLLLNVIQDSSQHRHIFITLTYINCHTELHTIKNEVKR